MSLAERPDLFEPALSIDAGNYDSGFTQHDEIGQLANAMRLRDLWPDYFLVLESDDGLVARAVSVPVSLEGEHRAELPANGWDGALMWAIQDQLDRVQPNAACALEINVDPAHRGRGHSLAAVNALRDRARSLGLDQLIAPVRPPGKAAEPRTPMSEYAARTREDGLPVDDWLRVHVRAGGAIVGVAPFSMLVTGTLDEWRSWTGEPFDRDGLIEVAGALAPVLVSTELDIATYAEPNVWVRHILYAADGR